GCRPVRLRRLQYDLRPRSSTGPPQRRNRARFVEPAGIGETDIDANLVETFSAFDRRRSGAFDDRARLVVLVARHDGNGRILGLSQAAPDHSPDWLRPGATLRRRISSRARARHSLFARGGAAFGSCFPPI